MDDSRMAVRLREQIVQFSGDLSWGLCKPARRFVAEAVYGIQAKKPVLLSEIARSLNERIPLKKTETRLSVELSRQGLRECLGENLLAKASSRILSAKLWLIKAQAVDSSAAWSFVDKVALNMHADYALPPRTGSPA